MPVLERIISLIAPHECVGCGSEPSLLCDPCRENIQTKTERCKICKSNPRTVGCSCFTPSFQLYAASTFTPLAQRLVWRMKFERAGAAGDAIARMCSPLVPGEANVISYIPTAPKRIRMRGYDHAERIARSVAQYTSLPMVATLHRGSNTRQVGADRATRHNQMHNAFYPISRPVIKDAHIVLLDDVLTTGASAQAACQTLYAAGARRVDVVVFARA